MAFSPQEQQILDYAKSNGKSAIEAKAALAKYRASSSPGSPTATPPAVSQPTPPASKPGFFQSGGAFDKVTGIARKVTDFIGSTAIADTYGTEIAKLNAANDEGRASIEAGRPTLRETAGSALKTGASLIPGVGVTGGLTKAVLAGAGAGYVYDIGQNIEEGKNFKDTVTPGITTVVGGLAVPVGPLAGKGASLAREGIESGVRAVTNSPVVKGALQTGIDLTERVPRFIGRRQTELRDQATKAQRLATAPEPIKKAIQAGVSEPIINTIEQADPATREGYRQIVDLAEESISTTGTLKTTARPEIVAGEAAAEQYKLIDGKRKEVGQAIGDATKTLSKTSSVNMRPSYQDLDDQLTEIGVKLNYGETGVGLDFSGTGFSNAQRAKINELYKLATEGGDNLTPYQIHDKDRLFSQLQREARMEGIGDIIVETQEGPMSLFSVFRDVYSSNLDSLSPEIKKLNSQYRNLRTFTDDIESSIIKSGKFETNKNVDPAEYAQTNLRRLFSEAGSAADYRAIADEMDNASRALGYAGAKPEDLARFAYEVRKIYPETTPRTGFEGSVKASIGGAVQAVLTAGKADLSDQQKALRELLEAIGTAPQ